MKIDHEYTREVTCPYCGHENSDSWELSGGDGEEFETECGSCEKEFTYARNIEITYSTFKKEEDCEHTGTIYCDDCRVKLPK